MTLGRRPLVRAEYHLFDRRIEEDVVSRADTYRDTRLMG